jgi:hypothetical protein
VWTVCWVATASAGFILVAAEAGRYPLSVVLICAGVLVPAFLLGLLGGSFLLCLWGLLYVPIVLIAAAVSGEALIILALPVAVVAAALMIAIGVAIGRRITLGSLGVGALVAAIAVVSLAPAALGFIQRHRTVRVHRSQPIAIDERAGTVSGVGLGDGVNQVISKFGHTGPRGPYGGIGPFEGDDSTGGPQVLPVLTHEKNLRYRKLYFATDGRVRYLAVADKQARLSRGVGPGDSISLVKRAYPELKCGEDVTGADADIYDPACHGQIAPGVWAYINGDYTKPGSPVIEVWLADFDLAAGKTGRLKPLSP